jgi:myo-inositol-1(or 4)-monophosphatase
MKYYISHPCLNSLKDTKRYLSSLGVEGRQAVATTKDEPVTKGDLGVSKFLRKSLLVGTVHSIITSEEAGEIFRPENPKWATYFDEVDGTFNYERGILPCVTVISAFEYSSNLKFKDAIFAGILDHTSDRLWYAERGEGCFLNNQRVQTSGQKDLGKKTSVIIDHGPCSKDVSRFLDVYANSWVRNVSSAGFHLAGVASGNFDAYLLSIQKAHELGAGYLMIKEAGGVVIDFNGNPIGKQEFDFNKTYPIIAAATPELAEEIRRKIRD